MRTRLFMIATSLWFTGCAQNDGESSRSAPGTGKTSIAAASSVTTRSGTNFIDWRNRLDEWLPVELAAEATGLPAAEASRAYRPGLALTYEWPSARSADYAGMTIPIKNKVSLAVPRAGIAPDAFRNRFKPLNPEQHAMLQRQVEREVKKRGLDGTSADMARDLTGMIGQRHPTQDVVGLGDDAVWEIGKRSQTLHVLLDANILALEMNISDDPSVNKAAAIALAHRLIKRL